MFFLSVLIVPWTKYYYGGFPVLLSKSLEITMLRDFPTQTASIIQLCTETYVCNYPEGGQTICDSTAHFEWYPWQQQVEIPDSAESYWLIPIRDSAESYWLIHKVTK